MVEGVDPPGLSKKCKVVLLDYEQKQQPQGSDHSFLSYSRSRHNRSIVLAVHRVLYLGRLVHCR